MKVHIAGFAVRVGNQLRQRCAWCGDEIIDVDLSCIMAPVKADGSPPDPYAVWEMNALVAVDGNHSWVITDHGGELPPECCTKDQPKLAVVRTMPTREASPA